ncbi:glycosyltransferase family 8 protein [Methanosphaera sp. ISO3-F5]|uniref:glycosyltransferase family 8 protein n=1 Tax=Methanosphaera sp. ISO3-F5 TaxID=1452353 RepID=UPI002B257459|nr:glycosyltransferase family 8 protein [Methanosphaera sp. ISO3-F5]WQH63409.1 glycosyltransferase family 8 protein [Methanosphaera sp. ISO3-F5]
MINIVYASDDNYVPYLLVSLNSLFENNNQIKLNIFILSNEISDNNQNQIKKLSSKYSNVHVFFIELKNIINKIQFDNSNELLDINLTSYCRLFMEELLPKNISKIIYFDCDSLIVSSLKELWNIDISKYFCAGVLDPTPVYYKKIIGLNENDIYINAGMLLINLDKWREFNLSKKFLKFLEEHKHLNIHHDQGVINGVLKDEILVISPKFNYLGPFHGKDYKTTLKWYGVSYSFYDQNVMNEAQNNPVFIHFSGRSIERPWVSKENFYRKLYEYYVNSLDYDKNKIFKNTGTISLMGKLQFYVSNNKYGYLFMKIVPKKIAVMLKNFVVYKQVK